MHISIIKAQLSLSPRSQSDNQTYSLNLVPYTLTFSSNSNRVTIEAVNNSLVNIVGTKPAPLPGLNPGEGVSLHIRSDRDLSHVGEGWLQTTVSVRDETPCIHQTLHGTPVRAKQIRM